MSRIDSSSEQFLIALRAIEQAAQRAHEQISSGRRVSSVSDEPHGVPALLELQTEIALADRLKHDLSRVRAEADSAEGSLQEAVKILDQARAIALQGAGDLDAATKRPLLAQQVTGLLERMVALSRTESEGRYVFSGDLDQAPVYEVNLASTSGVNQLTNPQATRLIQHSGGATFPGGRLAQDIFDLSDGGGNPVSGNVFDALNSLRVALNSNDEPAIQASIAKLQAAGDHVNNVLGWYGDLQNRVISATAVAEKFHTQATIRLGEMRDTDMPAAIVELTQIQAQQQAALLAQSNSRRLSLFDFLR
jgi:flagellar hook-associated protein 3 FlgL